MVRIGLATRLLNCFSSPVLWCWFWVLHLVRSAASPPPPLGHSVDVDSLHAYHADILVFQVGRPVDILPIVITLEHVFLDATIPHTMDMTQPLPCALFKQTTRQDNRAIHFVCQNIPVTRQRRKASGEKRPTTETNGNLLGNSVVTDVQFGHLFLVCIKYVALLEVTCGLFRKTSHCS